MTVVPYAFDVIANDVRVHRQRLGIRRPVLGSVSEQVTLSSTHSPNTVSERGPADAVQGEVDGVVERGQHVGDFHEQVDLGVQRRSMFRPQRPLLGVQQVERGVGQLEADRRTADGDQHDGQLTLSGLEARRRCCRW